MLKRISTSMNDCENQNIYLDVIEKYKVYIKKLTSDYKVQCSNEINIIEENVELGVTINFQKKTISTLKDILLCMSVCYLLLLYICYTSILR